MKMKRLQPENKEKIVKCDFFRQLFLCLYNIFIGKGGGKRTFSYKFFVGIRNN